MKEISKEKANQEIITGIVERVTFHNEQNGYTVMRFLVKENRKPVTVIGTFTSIKPGESLRLAGHWTTHPQYGQQFQVAEYSVTRPATLKGIQKYLGSGLIKGIGPVTAKRIVEHFKESTLDVIENDISRLGEVSGIARKRVEMIQSAWEEQRAIKEVMLFLQSHGVSTSFAVKIFKHYGNAAVSIVEQTPYRLATDIFGIGFRSADQIARNLGLPADSPERLKAGLRHVLTEASEEGHCYLPLNELVKRAAKILKIEDQARLGAMAAEMIAEGQLKKEIDADDLAIYLLHFWQAEHSVSRRLKSLLKNPVWLDESRVDVWLDRFAENRGLQLSAEQRSAVKQTAKERVLILTGGPGTGKTTTLRAMVLLFEAMGRRIALASPTGRAAQRLAEVTGREAKTIHRLLEFDPSQMAFRRNEESPLEADVVIIDEASMIDITLASHLFKAIGIHSQLVMVGDVDQLPSVGAGTVLRDLINSTALPVARLTQVFRQAEESLIIRNAHRINRGEFPQLIKPGEQQSDCYFIEAGEPETIVELIVKSVASSLPKRFGYDPLRDIQVLAPMNRGLIGTTNLNAVLQDALNPADSGKAELARGNRTLRAGDKVIQRVNNYKLDVFNGDIGTVQKIDPEEQIVAVRFADRTVYYDFADLMELGHGFCVTVHKSQGSEYPAVVIPLHTSHFLMLSRNLLYTALTRAKKTVVLVGTTKALKIAMQNLEATHRYTGLARELRW